MPIFLNKKHPVILVITGWDDVGGLAETTTNEAASLPSHECRVWPRHEWHHHEHVSSTRRNVKASPNGEAPFTMGHFPSSSLAQLVLATHQTFSLGLAHAQRMCVCDIWLSTKVMTLGLSFGIHTD
jgi:hypothetical protein